jgi:hypothetical protein
LGRARLDQSRGSCFFSSYLSLDRITEWHGECDGPVC